MIKNKNKDMLKVGIVGSRQYLNALKIKDYIYRLKLQFEDHLQIVSGGCKTGADKYAKKFALEFHLNYGEFPPAHNPYNIYCISKNISTDPWRYGKTKYNTSYSVTNYFKRNKEIAEYCDVLLAFIPAGVISRGTNNTIKYAKEFGKKVLIFN